MVAYPEQRLMFLLKDSDTVLTGLSRGFNFYKGGRVLVEARSLPNIGDIYELVLPINPGKYFRVTSVTTASEAGYFEVELWQIEQTE